MPLSKSFLPALILHQIFNQCRQLFTQRLHLQPLIKVLVILRKYIPEIEAVGLERVTILIDHQKHLRVEPVQPHAHYELVLILLKGDQLHRKRGRYDVFRSRHLYKSFA